MAKFYCIYVKDLQLYLPVTACPYLGAHGSLFFTQPNVINHAPRFWRFITMIHMIINPTLDRSHSISGNVYLSIYFYPCFCHLYGFKDHFGHIRTHHFVRMVVWSNSIIAGIGGVITTLVYQFIYFLLSF